MIARFGEVVLVQIHFLVLASICAQAAEPSVVISEARTIADASFRGIAVRNSLEAWVGGSNGTVMRTTDGGESWKRVAIPGSDGLDFRDIELPAARTIVVMTAGPGEKSCVYRSTDSGETWARSLHNTNEKCFYNAIAFWSATDGMLVGDPLDGRIDLYRTTDGGATWKRLPESDRLMLSDREYGFAASGTNLTVNGQSNAYIATGGSRARVLISINRGQQWTSLPTPVASGLESTGIFSVAFRNQQHGVVVGGDYKHPDVDHGNVSWTSDGGSTWTLVQQRPGIPHKACVRHLTGKKWLAVGRTGVIYSNSDGHSWTTISDKSFFTFDVHREGGWLAGADGRVARFKINAE